MPLITLAPRAAAHRRLIDLLAIVIRIIVHDAQLHHLAVVAVHALRHATPHVEAAATGCHHAVT